MNIRRFTRLTSPFLKKLANHAHTVAIFLICSTCLVDIMLLMRSTAVGWTILKGALTPEPHSLLASRPDALLRAGALGQF